MWEYTDYNAYPNIVLRECFIVDLRAEGDRLVMDFDDAGFKLNADHPANPYADLRRTGKAQLCFEKCDVKTVQVTFDKRIRFLGRGLTTLREEPSLKSFRAMLASGRCSFEFSEEYYGSFCAIFCGNLHTQDETYVKYCQIKLSYQDMIYSWNEIQPEKTW